MAESKKRSSVPRPLIALLAVAVSMAYACSNTTITSTNSTSDGGSRPEPAASGGQSGSSNTRLVELARGGNASVGGGATATGLTAVGAAAGAINATAGVGSASTVAGGGTTGVNFAPGGALTSAGVGANTSAGSSSSASAAAGGVTTSSESSGGATGGSATTSPIAGGTSSGSTGFGGSSTAGSASLGGRSDVGAAGSGNPSPCATVAALVHGSVTDLPGNLCRVTYDFSNANQMSDWVIASNTHTQVSLTNQLMLLSYLTGASNSLAAVQFKLPLRATRLTFKGTTVEGGRHLNAYLAVRWTGEWAPMYGYGFILNGEGRMLTSGGTSTKVPGSLALTLNHTYDVQIAVNPTELVWNTDADTVTYPIVASYPGKDRNIVLGGWESTVAFDDIVIEGEF